MATVNAISVALFNAAAGGYSSQIAKDPNSIANAVGMILERDISTDAQFVDHLLANFGVQSYMSVYSEAKRALDSLVASVGRGSATQIAIDFLKSNEGAPNDYSVIALNFALKVGLATQYSATFSNERDITKLVSVITGFDTDQVAINNALAAVNPNFSANLTAALAAAEAKAAADKAAEIAALKVANDAAAKNAADKAAADLKAANDKAIADAATAKVLADKALADANAALKLANDKAAEAAIKAAADKAAAVAAVDKTTDNAAAITAYLKAAAAISGVVINDNMSDSQLLAAIKASDNQVVAGTVDKTIDNPQAITAYLRSVASALGATGTSTMADAELINAIKVANDVSVAAVQKQTDDNLALSVKNASDSTIADLRTQLTTAQNKITTAVNEKAAEDLIIINDLRTQLSRALNQTGQTYTLSVNNDTIMAMAGGADTVNATQDTYGSEDVIVDTSVGDGDTLNLITNTDISNTPVIVGFENINVSVPTVFAGTTGITTLSFNADNIRSSTLNFDATNVASLVTDLAVTNVANLMKLTSTIKYTSVNINGDANANLTYIGAPGALVLESVAGSLNNVTATVTKDTAGTVRTNATGTFILTTSTDTTVTANSASNVNVTSSGQATVTANGADIVSVTATEEALVTANSAELITIAAGDGIDTTSTSVINSTLTSSNTNNITVSLRGNTAPVILNINSAPTVNRIEVSGSQNVSIKVGLDDIDGLGNATNNDTSDDNVLTVVKSMSAGTVNLVVTTSGGDADFSAADVANIELATDLGVNDDLTVASNALIVVAQNQSYDLSILPKTPSSPTNALRISIKDDLAAGITGNLNGGISLSNFAYLTLTNNDATTQAILGNVAASGTTMTIASGVQGFTAANYAINLGVGTLRVTGTAPVNLGSNVTASDVAAADATGNITLGLIGSGKVGTVVTGGGNDDITIKTAARTSGDYSISTGAGSDTLTVLFAEGFNWNGGVGYDTLKLTDSLDLSSDLFAVSMTSVDAIQLDTDNSGAESLTIKAATFNSNPAFALLGGATSRDTLIVNGLETTDTIDASGVSVVTSQAYLTLNGNGGNDTIIGSEFADIINGGAGADVMQGGNYDDTYIFNTGDVSTGESIFEASTYSGTDTVSVVTTTVFTEMTAASFDEIEAITIASGQTATFTGAQLTGEAIAISGSAGGTETVIVNVGLGATFVSGLTSGSNIDSIQYFGDIGSEIITGSDLPETITGGRGDDLLTGGGGIDTYIFSDAASTGNGLDSIVFSSVSGNAVEDILNFSAYTFVGPNPGSNRTESKKVFTDTNVTSAVTGAATGQNILFLTNSYFASAATLAAANTLFTACDTGNVLIVYAGSASENARIALCELDVDGDVVTAKDMAILVGMTIGNAATGLSTSNFILG